MKKFLISIFMILNIFMANSQVSSCDDLISFSNKYFAKKYSKRVSYADLYKGYSYTQLVIVRADLSSLSGCMYSNLDTLDDYLNIFNDSLSFQKYKKCLISNSQSINAPIVMAAIVLDTSYLVKNCIEINILHSYIILNKHERLIWYCLYSNKIPVAVEKIIRKDLKVLYKRKRLIRYMKKSFKNVNVINTH